MVRSVRRNFTGICAGVTARVGGSLSISACQVQVFVCTRFARMYETSKTKNESFLSHSGWAFLLLMFNY